MLFFVVLATLTSTVLGSSSDTNFVQSTIKEAEALPSWPWAMESQQLNPELRSSEIPTLTATESVSPFLQNQLYAISKMACKGYTNILFQIKLIFIHRLDKNRNHLRKFL